MPLRPCDLVADGRLTPAAVDQAGQFVGDCEALERLNFVRGDAGRGIAFDLRHVPFDFTGNRRGIRRERIDVVGTEAQRP